MTYTESNWVSKIASFTLNAAASATVAIAHNEGRRMCSIAV